MSALTKKGKGESMKEYDVVVIGSGAGMVIVEGALSQGLRVALVDKGPLGGTCLNVGCIPSKMLIYPADRIAEIQEAKKLGIDVTIVQRRDRLVRNEEPEISELLKREMAKRMKIYTNTEVSEVKKNGDGYTIIGRDKIIGEEKEFTAEHIMIATGRKSNADLLKVENTGVETDERGYVKVNDYLETSKENIWALGDAIGKYMFRHVANHEALVAWHNSIHTEEVKMEYRAIPHAVFSHPQIASVGLTEEQAKKDYDIVVGKANYSAVAKGEAMMETESFAKAIVEKSSMKILGFHIIGPYAPILIQEVITTHGK